MHYPVWSIPGIGGSWLVGLISVIHVFLSHFAVGGGIFFAITEWIAYKRGDDRIYQYLKKHSKFFLLATTVSGAVTGVGIWFSISLVSPDGTGTLIQNYTLGWATEYLFFLTEIATIFVYYYTWDKISKETHLTLARWYAVLSVFTLVIINGILSFMLTPGNWVESKLWYEGFFNPTYWPSLFLRIFVMLAIAGMYSLVTSARIKNKDYKELKVENPDPEHKNEDDFRAYMLKYSSKWFFPVFVLGPIFGFWFFSQVPGNVLDNIFNGIQASGVGNFSILARAIYLSLILSGTILIFAYIGPYLNPRGFSFIAALAFMVCGLGVTAISEWSREMLRKPYVIYGYMYSNGIKVTDVDKINEEGFLAHSKWQAADNESPGEFIFKQQCMKCHTTNGYRSMTRLLGGRDKDAIKGFLTLMHETDIEKNSYLKIMPPFVGTNEEIDMLASYLSTLNNNGKIKAHH